MKNLFRVFVLLCCFCFLAVSEANNPKALISKEKASSESKRVVYSYGIDISRYQHINFDLLDSNLHFIICKASEGIKLIDPKFNYHWSNIKSGVKKGAYHFFRPGVSGIEQAKLFLSVVNFQPGHLLPVIDVEYSSQYNRIKPGVYAKHLKEMINEIERVLCVKPIIYTNAGFWNKYLAPSMRGTEKEYHLWIADYRLRDEPKVPKGWQDWTIWQHSCRGNVNGILNEVDLNICKVDLEELIIPEI
jgi:lysozyme